MSKGDKPRPCNKQRFNESFDKIFGTDKNNSTTEEAERIKNIKLSTMVDNCPCKKRFYD